jgi:hypothetical protein
MDGWLVSHSGESATKARFRLALVMWALGALACFCSGSDTGVREVTRVVTAFPVTDAASIGGLESLVPQATGLPPTEIPTGVTLPPLQPTADSSGDQSQPPQPTQPPTSLPTIVPATRVVPTVRATVPITTSAEDIIPGVVSSSGGQSAAIIYCDPQEPAPYIALFPVPGRSGLGFSDSPYWQTGIQGTYGFEYILWGCHMESLSGQIVRVTLFLPNGTSEVHEFAFNAEEALSRWLSIPGESLGQYTWLVETSIGSGELSFFINAPSAPLIRAVCQTLFPISGGVDVMLVGFQPNERVEVQHYSGFYANANEYVNTYYISVNSSGVGYAALGLSPEDNVVALGSNRMISIFLSGTETIVSGYDELNCLARP